MFAKVLGFDRRGKAFSNIDFPIELLALRRSFDDPDDAIGQLLSRSAQRSA